MSLINIEVMLIVLSVTCILQFFILGLMEIFFKKFIDLRCIVALEKFVLLFLCIPAIFISVYILQFNNNFNQTILGMDYNLLRIVTRENFDTLNHGYLLFAIIFAFTWIVGFLISFLIIYIKENNILRKLKRVSENITENNSLYFVKKELEQELKIFKKIRMYRCSSINSPFIAGIIKPIIFIPTKEYPGDIFRLMLKHELYHYKNKDLLFRKIAVLIKGIYWFNPFIGYFINKFFYNCEMVCDTLTLHKESKNIRSKYAHIILNMLHNQKRMAGVSGFMGNDIINIEKRIENIMNTKIKQYKVATILLSTIIVLMSPATAYASAEMVTVLQDEYVRSLANEKSVKETDYVYEISVEKTEKINYKGLDLKLNNTRGANLIDCTVNDRTRAVIESASFKKGDTVQFILAGTNQSDSFRAGIMDSKGYSRYVNSSNGTLSYTFTIAADGVYDLYILGNTSSNVKVTGSITV